jgi:hypothetical protein
VTQDELNAQAAKDAKKWFTICADNDVPYAKVVEVVEALKAAGVTEFSFAEARVGDGKYRVANLQANYKLNGKHHFSMCRPSEYPQFLTVSWPAEGERPACWLRTYPDVSKQTESGGVKWRQSKYRIMNRATCRQPTSGPIARSSLRSCGCVTTTSPLSFTVNLLPFGPCTTVSFPSGCLIRRTTTLAWSEGLTTSAANTSPGTLRSAGYPRPTQDSLPAAGQALPDGLFTRKIPLKGFRVVSLHLIPLSQASCRNHIARVAILPRRVGQKHGKSGSTLQFDPLGARSYALRASQIGGTMKV